ncbi:MAG TPA: NAD(P)-binding domain-containing protein [Myxococcaceae bacterium]|nr:NAD(P)-binding domain-containing protein [Myxococcaceae bacterium]
MVIIGAGPYGLSLAAHLAARNFEHRIFGTPMRFWLNVAAAGSRRYLKSYCFGTNLSTPKPGFAFADYNSPRQLETFEPCSISNFAEYGQWFQENNVPWVEPIDVVTVDRQGDGFALKLANDAQLLASRVVIATGLSDFAYTPSALGSLSSQLCTHTAKVTSFESFRGQDVAVIGGGQSALEAAALLHEAGARPQLLVREESVLWQTRVMKERSLWRKIRSPITGLGTGPKAWALTRFPGGMHRLPASWRTRFVRNHLPAEGAWWLRERVEKIVPIHCNTAIVTAAEQGSRLALRLRESKTGSERTIRVDHVIAGSGYLVDVERMSVLAPDLRARIQRLEAAPRLNKAFESSVPGLHVIGPASAMSFGPLFRFVVGAEYTAETITAHLASTGVRAA